MKYRTKRQQAQHKANKRATTKQDRFISKQVQRLACKGALRRSNDATVGLSA